MPLPGQTVWALRQGVHTFRGTSAATYVLRCYTVSIELLGVFPQVACPANSPSINSEPCDGTPGTEKCRPGVLCLDNGHGEKFCEILVESLGRESGNVNVVINL